MLLAKKIVARTMLRTTKREVGVSHGAMSAATSISTIFVSFLVRERIVEIEREKKKEWARRSE